MNDESGKQMLERMQSSGVSPQSATTTGKLMTTSEPGGSKRRSPFRTLSKTEVNQALTYYLRKTHKISSTEEVIDFTKSPDALDIRIKL